VTAATGAAPAARDTAAIEQLATRVARAAVRCTDVARLAPGPQATYLPDHAIPGVVLTDDTVRVVIVVRYGRSLREIADEVRASVREVAPGMRVDVVIEDLDEEGA
jgi:hypothetical protein